jgi:hypothetical protein
MPRWLVVLVTLVLGWTVLVPAQDTPKIRVVRVSLPDARRPAEASVALNPTNPDHVIATFIQSTAPVQQPRSTNWQYVSTDGGLTWNGAPPRIPTGACRATT